VLEKGMRERGEMEKHGGEILCIEKVMCQPIMKTKNALSLGYSKLNSL
jgi:hypothetical protein